MTQNADEKNSIFWDDLCGSQAAQALGVTDRSPASLKRYDDWYLGFYPYLLRHVPTGDMRGKAVLEVGLGYGTLAQQIVDAGADYTGLDVAPGPVSMIKDRIMQTPGATGRAVQGSILQPEMPKASFDFVVAIGALHHTGDLSEAIESCLGLLKIGGTLLAMVYNAYSYRRFIQARRETLSYWLAERRGYRGSVGGEGKHRAAYDINSAGSPAPHTEWISKTSLQCLCRRFSSCSVTRENIDQEPPFKKRSREELLQTPIPRICGLDLYFNARR